jgi:hypothetical protein
VESGFESSQNPAKKGIANLDGTLGTTMDDPNIWWKLSKSGHRSNLEVKL